MIVENFSWNQLNQPLKDLKPQFKENVDGKLDDLRKELSPSTDGNTVISQKSVYKVIDLLCRKKTPCADAKKQQQFFESIQPILEKEQPATLFRTIWTSLKSKDEYNRPKNDILIDLCFKALGRSRPPLARQIVQLISEAESIPFLKLVERASIGGKSFFPIIKDFLEKIPSETLIDYINYTNESGESLLILAARFSCNDLILFLINHGANVDVQNLDGQTPLSLAIENKMSIEVIQDLILHMKNFSFEDKDRNNYLLLALKNKCFQITSLLLDKVKINHQDSMGNTALHLTVGSVQIPATKELMRRGADPFVVNSNNICPLNNNYPTDSRLAIFEELDLIKFSSKIGISLDFMTINEGQFVEKFTNEQKIFEGDPNEIDLRKMLRKKYEDTMLSSLKPELAIQHPQAFAGALFAGFDRLAMRILECCSKKIDDSLALACRSGFPKIVRFLLDKQSWSLEELTEALTAAAYCDAEQEDILRRIITELIKKELSVPTLFQQIITFSDTHVSFQKRVLFKSKALIELLSAITGKYTPFEVSAMSDGFLLIAINHDNLPAILFLIEKGATIDNKDTAVVNKIVNLLAGSNDVQIRQTLFSLLVKRENILANTFQNVNEKTLHFLYLTFLIDPKWRDKIEIECLENGFIQLLNAIDQLDLDRSFIQKVEKVLGKGKVKAIVKKCLTSLIEKRGLTLQTARKLGELFPEETALSVKLKDGLIEVNCFVLVAASPVFQSMLAKRSGEKPLTIELSHFDFKKIYDYLSENVLDFAGIEKEQSKKKLKEIFDSYQIEAPMDLSLEEKWNSKKNPIQEFLRKPYHCFNKREIKIGPPLVDGSEKSNDCLSEYFKYHPDIKEIRIISDEKKAPTSLFEMLNKKFPNLEKIHIEL